MSYIEGPLSRYVTERAARITTYDEMKAVRDAVACNCAEFALQGNQWGAMVSAWLMVAQDRQIQAHLALGRA
jgi:hypothetical protein